MDKDKELQQASNEANEKIAAILGISSDPVKTYPLMQSALGTKRMTLFTLAVFCAYEMERCLNGGAYLAGCLMGVSANETLLSLMAVLLEQKVVGTVVYHRSAKEKTYELTISHWRFDKLIHLSEELHWIPNDIVNPDLLEALLKDFPVAAATVYPKMGSIELERKLEAIRKSPGNEMLRFSQDLRNLVHGPRWLRTASKFIEAEFQENWKLAMIISTEVAKCLLARFGEESSRILEEAKTLLKGLGEEEIKVVRQSVLERLNEQ
jgi:hypothetical protein